MRRIRYGMTALAVLAAPLSAADVVVDKERDHYYEGRWDQRDARRDLIVLVDVEQGPRTVTFPKAQLGQSIVVLENTTLIEVFKQRKERLALADIDGWVALADWCAHRCTPKLVPQERMCLEEVLALDPEHEKTRLRLGYARQNGRWVNLREQREQREQAEAAWRADLTAVESWERRRLAAAPKGGEIEWLEAADGKLLYRTKAPGTRKLGTRAVDGERQGLALADLATGVRTTVVADDWAPIRGPRLAGGWVVYALGKLHEESGRDSFHDLHLYDVASGKTLRVQDNRQTMAGAPLISDRWVLWRHHRVSAKQEGVDEPIYYFERPRDLDDARRFTDNRERRRAPARDFEEFNGTWATLAGDRVIWFVRGVGLRCYNLKAELEERPINDATITQARPAAFGDRVAYRINGQDKRGVWIFDYAKREETRLPIDWDQPTLWEHYVAGLAVEDGSQRLMLYDLRKETRRVVAEAPSGAIIRELRHWGTHLAWVQYEPGEGVWVLYTARPGGTGSR